MGYKILYAKTFSDKLCLLVWIFASVFVFRFAFWIWKSKIIHKIYNSITNAGYSQRMPVVCTFSQPNANVNFCILLVYVIATYACSWKFSYCNWLSSWKITISCNNYNQWWYNFYLNDCFYNYKYFKLEQFNSKISSTCRNN